MGLKEMSRKGIFVRVAKKEMTDASSRAWMGRKTWRVRPDGNVLAAVGI
jgi:hypothetical protein